MLLEAPEQQIRRELRKSGVEPSDEEVQIVARWLNESADRPDSEDGSSRQRAILQGGKIYRSFTDAFAATYLAPDAPGARLVQRALERRHGFAPSCICEAVLERIRDRRLHLLDRFRRKYQPSLFGPLTFDSTRVRGYMGRVAQTESFHVPFDDQVWRRRPLPLTTPRFLSPHPHNEDAVDYRDLADRLLRFYGAGNGFTADQALEAAVSLGFGPFVANSEVRERCSRFLCARLDSWEQEGNRLAERAGLLLTRLEDLREQSAGAFEEPALRQAREELEGRIARLARRRQRWLSALRPRPSQVQELLAGVVEGPLGGLRHRRLCREGDLLRQRFEQGWFALQRSHHGRLSADLSTLWTALRDHLAEAPPSPGCHGLDDGERQRREACQDRWRHRGVELLRRLSALREAVRQSVADAERILCWLLDAEALYDLWVVPRQKGVVAALGQWHGARLHWILRDVPPGAARVPGPSR